MKSWLAPTPRNLPIRKLAAHPLPPLLEAFFCQRLQTQRQLSPETIASYRDTLRLLLHYVQEQTHRAPSQQVLEDWDAPYILTFLEHLDAQRDNCARTRNVRLSAIHTFMRFAAEQAPEVVALTARVLAIPMKRFERPLLGCLSTTEMQAILLAPNPDTLSGQRDRLLFELMYNTGARVSEIAALNRQDIQTQPLASMLLRGKASTRYFQPASRRSYEPIGGSTARRTGCSPAGFIPIGILPRPPCNAPSPGQWNGWACPTEAEFIRYVTRSQRIFWRQASIR